MKSESDRATEAWTEIWMWNERWGHTSVVSKTFLDNSRIFGQLKIRCITLLPTLCIISTINFISTKLETFLLFESDAWQHLNFNIISSFVISQYNKQCNAWRTYGNLRIVYVSLLVFSSLKYVKRNGRMGLLRVNTSASSQTQELLTSPTDWHQYDGNNDVRIGADYETKAIINDHIHPRRTCITNKKSRRARNVEM